MTTNRRKARLARIFNRPLAVTVHSIDASRAIFESQDLQRVDLRLTTDEGDRLTLELRDKQVYELIQQLTISYQAMHPILPSNASARWHGME